MYNVYVYTIWANRLLAWLIFSNCQIIGISFYFVYLSDFKVTSN